jgi:hypothetical protein
MKLRIKLTQVQRDQFAYEFECAWRQRAQIARCVFEAAERERLNELRNYLRND